MDLNSSSRGRAHEIQNACSSVKEAEKLMEWRNEWNVGSMSAFENIGLQVFVAMADDPKFRQLVKEKLKAAEQAAPRAAFSLTPVYPDRPCIW